MDHRASGYFYRTTETIYHGRVGCPLYTDVYQHQHKTGGVRSGGEAGGTHPYPCGTDKRGRPAERGRP